MLNIGLLLAFVLAATMLPAQNASAIERAAAERVEGGLDPGGDALPNQPPPAELEPSRTEAEPSAQPGPATPSPKQAAAPAPPQEAMIPEDKESDTQRYPASQYYGKLSGFMLRPIGFALSVGGGRMSLPDAVLAREGIQTSTAFSANLRVAFLKLFFVEGGFVGGGAKDAASFSQVACAKFDSSDCELFESGVNHRSVSAKAGMLLRLFAPIDRSALQITFAGGMGRRGVWMSRDIANCDDCRTESLNVSGGYFASPELDLSWASNNHGYDGVAVAYGIKCEYEHYLSGDIISALWISGFLELM